MFNVSQFWKIKDQLMRGNSPASGTGISSLGPDGSYRAGTQFPNFQPIVVAKLHDDPNDNGGLDSNGFYVGILFSPDWFFNPESVPGLIPLPQVRLDCEQSSNYTFAEGDVIWAFQYGITNGSPDSTDDGYPLYIAMTDHVQFAKTQGDSYPQSSDGCFQYPATLLQGVNFNEVSCVEPLDYVDTGMKVIVYSLRGIYIPSGTIVMCYPAGLGGKDGPSNPDNQYPRLVTDWGGQYAFFLGTLASSGTDFGSQGFAITQLQAHNMSVTGAGGNQVKVTNPGNYAFSVHGTFTPDWSFASWTLGSPINDRLPCSMLLSPGGDSDGGAAGYIVSPTRGFGNFTLPEHLDVFYAGSMTAGATVFPSIGVNPEGPAATNITWNWTGTIMGWSVGNTG